MLMSASTPNGFPFLGLPLLPVQVQHLLTSNDLCPFRSRPLGRAFCLLELLFLSLDPEVFDFFGGFSLLEVGACIEGCLSDAIATPYR